MAKIDITDEQAFRAVLAADIATIDLAGNVFERRRLFTSRADFIAKTGKRIGTKTEIRFTEIDLLNVEDSPDEGFDDCPVAIVTYGIHVFHEFNDGRPDGSNSDKDFTDLLLRLRTHFLDKQSFTAGLARGRVEVTPIIPAEFTQFGPDQMLDCFGYSKDFTLKVYFYV